ncbi:MAG: hypothetical protein RLZZ399_218 [Verrucomicrobiota bacterium]
MKLTHTLLVASAILLTPKSEARDGISVGIGVSSHSGRSFGPCYAPFGHRYAPFGGRGYHSRHYYSAYPVFPAPIYLAQAPMRAYPPAVIYEYAPEPVTILRTPGVENRVIQVQAALRQRKYYSGAIDGLLGPGTQAAIRAYQVDRNLPVTGKLDPELISDLGL